MLSFEDAVEALAAGDFSSIADLFEGRGAPGRFRSRIEEWYEAGRFDDRPAALAQALTCACMLGRTRVAAFLLDRGVDPAEGAESGQTGFHYAVSGGHLETVELLIERKAPLEAKNMYGGTVLDQALWSALNEPGPRHASIIERLVAAGADVEAVGGRELVEEVLRRHAAQARADAGPKSKKPIETLRSLWEHVFWADARICDALSVGGSSVAEALREFAHVLGTEETWLARLEHRPPRAPVWPEPTPEGARGLMEQTHAACRAYLADLREEDLTTLVTYANSAGERFTDSTGDILLHVALHGQYHRGKVNLLLRQAGRTPAPTDFIAFVRGAPAATTADGRRKPGSR